MVAVIAVFGPTASGKTFVAECFVKETGLTAIKLKNFRSKWVGATEGNLERILSVVQAIGQIIVIIDEGDRAFGNQEGDDGGTSSRVIGRIGPPLGEMAQICAAPVSSRRKNAISAPSGRLLSQWRGP